MTSSARILSPSVATLTAIMLAGLSALPSTAAELRPETSRVFDEYVRAIDARAQADISAGRFLWADDVPERVRALRQGSVLVAPAGTHMPAAIPGGLVHHWIGAAFIPDAALADVLSVARAYRRFTDFYHPIVVEARPLDRLGQTDRFSMTVLNRSLFSRQAINGDYEASYVRVGEKKWLAITRSTRLQELENYGERSECRLPEGTGTGYIWRLHSIARFEARDGGVYIELEAIALSRDIPVSLRWVVNPLVRRISRSSLMTSLEQTRDAVRRLETAGDSRRMPEPTAGTSGLKDPLTGVQSLLKRGRDH